MRLHAVGAYTFGLAVAVSLGVASAGGAQADTTRVRVPVRKEQAAAPTKVTPVVPAAKAQAAVPAAREPAAVAAKPEPTVLRTDTMPRVATGDVVMPKDTAPPIVSRAECAMMPKAPAERRALMAEACGAMMPAQAQPQAKPAATRYLFGSSGFYLGAGAGTAVPYNELSDLGYDSGLDITIPVGWHRPGRTLGIRGTLAFDQVHADLASARGALPAMSGSAPDPKIYSGTLDAVLKFPIGSMAREGRGLSLYALGGGGVHLFRGFGGTTPLADVLGGDEVGNSRKNIHKWGVEAGAGMEWGLGPTAVFIESRWINAFTSGSRTDTKYLRWIPIGVGVIVR